MEETEQKGAESTTIGCEGCGASLKYKPGTNHMKCDYCGAENKIKSTLKQIHELNYSFYKSFKKNIVTDTEGKEEEKERFVKCTNCKATSSVDKNLKSAFCPYCSSPLLIEDTDTNDIIKPESLLPFKIEKEEAKENFKKWIRKLWFAPNNLKSTFDIDHFKGIYIPYWTYDTFTLNAYRGERGIYYYVNESYTTTENGKTVTKTKRVRKTRWYSVRGNVNVFFDDLLVPATNSLPEKYLNKLEPWDLENLVPFNKSYLSGYITEKYQIELEDGFEKAKKLTTDRINTAIRNDIGGDDQRISNVDTDYANITFKHTLFPVYVSAYNYNGKLYQFLINGRTNEVQGQRPYSWIKITLTVLAVMTVIFLVYYYSINYYT